METSDFLRPERHPVAPLSVKGPATCDLATGTCQASSLPCASDFDCACLGPDLLVYPDQPVQLHVSGYEEDWFGGDSLGVIEEWHFEAVQDEQDNACENPDIDWIAGDDLEGHLPQNAGCARFSIHYEIQDLGRVGTPLLSQAAHRLREAYRLVGDCSDDVGPCIGAPLVADGALPDPEPPSFLHPLLEITDEEFTTLFETDLYEKREKEEYVLNSLNVPALKAKIEWDLENEPEVAEAFLQKMRETFDEAWETLGDEVLLDLQLLRLAIPEEQFEQYFGGLPTPAPLPGSTRRFMKGAGQVGHGREATQLSLWLQCDPLRSPNRFHVRWKDDPYHHQRFELDLMLEIACEDPSEPMKTHSGRGLGSLNGEPGYLAEWTLVDEGQGPQNRDRLGIRILAPDGSVVHDIRGELRGQVHGREGDEDWESVRVTGLRPPIWRSASPWSCQATFSRRYELYGELLLASTVVPERLLTADTK